MLKIIESEAAGARASCPLTFKRSGERLNAVWFQFEEKTAHVISPFIAIA